MTGVSSKSPFDGDPKYENLKHLREVIGYKGWVDKWGKPTDSEGRDVYKRTGGKHA